MGGLFPHTFPNHQGKLDQDCHVNLLHFIEITYKLMFVKIRGKLFLDRGDMKNPRVLDRAGDESQMTPWDWDVCCQSLGSSAGTQGAGDPTSASSWMSNGSQYPAEECWVPAKRAGQKAEWMDFRGQPKDQGFLGKYKSGHASGENSCLYCILLYCISSFGSPSTPALLALCSWREGGKHCKELYVPGNSSTALPAAEPSCLGWGGSCWQMCCEAGESETE